MTENGEILVIDDNDRLRAAKTLILRRQRDEIVVAGAPEGARYVRTRAPQLGAGIKVRALGGDSPADRLEEIAGVGVDVEATSMVDLDPERQRRLIGFVEGADGMPTDMKVRVLSALRSGRAPQRLLDRIEARMGENG